MQGVVEKLRSLWHNGSSAEYAVAPPGHWLSVAQLSFRRRQADASGMRMVFLRAPDVFFYR
jgi:hypothetical protein